MGTTYLGGEYCLQIGGGAYGIFAYGSDYARHVLAGIAYLPD